MQLPRARQEAAWNLWKEMNLKKGIKRRFSKREGIDKALMRGAIRKLKKKNEEHQKVIEKHQKGIMWLFGEKVWLIKKNKKLQKLIEEHKMVIMGLSEENARLIKENKALEAGSKKMGEYLQANLRRPR